MDHRRGDRLKRLEEFSFNRAAAILGVNPAK
jgi:hypothetical protein